MPTPDETLGEIQTSEDWQEVNREERYKSLQSDYTKKTTELKDLKNSAQTQNSNLEYDPVELENFRTLLKNEGIVTKSDIEKVKESIVADQRFADLIYANPELKKNEKAIKEMAQLKWMAYEDVIEEYWFGAMDKLNKAKDRRLVGDRMLDGKREKQIEDMTSEEWEAHIKTIPKNNKFISADSF